MRASSRLVFLAIAGCFGNPPVVESSGTTTATGSTTTTDDTSGTSIASSSSTSASATDPASADATSEASTSTAEGSAGSTAESVDFALQFDGTGSVRSHRPIVWSSTMFTVEAWVEIVSDGAAGVIADQQNALLNAGWVLHVHPVSHTLAFALYDASGTPYLLEGPTAAEIGVGWHHIAGVRADGVMALFVDGVPVADLEVATTMSATDLPIALAAHNQPQPDEWRLREASIDDVRIVSRALYEAPFDPPTTFEDIGDVVLLLRLDEGMGDLTEDPVTGQGFDVLNGAWVMGVP